MLRSDLKIMSKFAWHVQGCQESLLKQAGLRSCHPDTQLERSMWQAQLHQDCSPGVSLARRAGLAPLQGATSSHLQK